MTDTKLSAACSLHTASGSTASSTSSRKKRLVEIAEEDEDDLPPTKRTSVVGDLEPPKTPVDPNWNADPVTLNADLASSPEQSKFAAEDEPPTFVGADGRPSTSDSYERSLSGTSGYPYGAKPKIKLGPRPSLDAGIRPQTAGNFRPVSAIPAGYKLFGKGSKRNKSRDSNVLASPQEEIASMDFGTAADADEDSKENADPALTASNSENPVKPTKKISPEKARLKKAMQLREKKRLAAEKAAQEGGSPDVAVDLVEVDPEDDDVAEDAPLVEDELNDDETAADDLPFETPASEGPESFVDAQSNSSLADQNSELTMTDSHPASPALGTSEETHSTKASSISEDTNETIREKDDTDPRKKEAEVLAAVAAIPDKDHANMTAADHIKATEAALFGAPDADADTSEEPVAIPISKFSTNNSSGAPAIEEPVAETATEPEAKTEEPTQPVPTIPVQPSAQDLLAATRAAAEPIVETPVVELQRSPLAAANATEVDKDVAPAEYETKEPAVEQEVDTKELETAKEKRKGLVPIQTANIDKNARQDNTPTAAAVIAEEDAKPVITETPVTPVTPEGGSIAALPLSTATTPQPFVVRTISNPVRGNLIPPSDVSQSSARSMSSGAAYLHKITQQQQANANLSSKSNVGSSISQRIKALEKLSATSVTEVRPVSRERPQSTFFSVKKSEPLRAPSVIDRASSLRRNAPPSRDGSDSSPETLRLERSGSISNRLSMFQPNPDSPRGTSESISVMAKIVRDPSHQMPDNSRDTAGFNPLDLKQSPLFVSHQKPPQETAAHPTLDSPVGSPVDEEPRSSIGMVRGIMKDKRTTSADSVPVASPPPGGSGSFSPRLSFSSRRSGKEAEEVSSSDLPDSSNAEDKTDSKLSRASRFMRRLSTLSGSRSKNTLPAAAAAAKSPLALDEEQQAEASRPSTTGTSPWIVAYLGDVNVQFPDSLLWKRRNMCIDSQGFLVLSALPAPSSRAAQGTKRYHLSEFRPPYCPDVEVQELPNSVVFDFIEGTSLQLACEDRSGQMSVLHDLTEAYGKHGEQFGQ